MRRGSVGTIILTILGLGILSIGVLALSGALDGCMQREDQTDEDRRAEIPIPQGPLPDRPVLDFPAHVRCKDEAVNKFIEDFYRICYLAAEGRLGEEYEEFRRMISTRVDPFTPERFKRALKAVETVTIENIEILPEVEDVPPPVYVVKSHIQLREQVRTEEHERTIIIVVFKELGRWVMAPAPSHLREPLNAFVEFMEQERQAGREPVFDVPSSRPTSSEDAQSAS